MKDSILIDLDAQGRVLGFEFRFYASEMLPPELLAEQTPDQDPGPPCEPEGEYLEPTASSRHESARGAAPTRPEGSPPPGVVRVVVSAEADVHDEAGVRGRLFNALDTLDGAFVPMVGTDSTSGELEAAFSVDATQPEDAIARGMSTFAAALSLAGIGPVRIIDITLEMSA